MAARQRKSDRVVIETGWLPSGCCMAFLAGLRKAERNVIRIGCFLKICHVASDAGRRRSFVLPAHMTRRTIQSRVHSGQREAGELQVIKPRAQPRIDRVALLALRRETAGDVVGRCRLLKCALVAGVTLNRQSLKLPDGFTLVAVGTIQACMPSNQWEAVVVLLHPLQNDIPTLDRMALLAVRAHLATMEIGVAVRAMRSRVRKHGLRVALRTAHAHMQTAQRITRLVVIEFGERSNRLPAYRGVTVLAGDTQIAVGASGDGWSARLAG